MTVKLIALTELMKQIVLVVLLLGIFLAIATQEMNLQQVAEMKVCGATAQRVSIFINLLCVVRYICYKLQIKLEKNLKHG